jgi:hypothetical protein
MSLRSAPLFSLSHGGAERSLRLTSHLSDLNSVDHACLLRVIASGFLAASASSSLSCLLASLLFVSFRRSAFRFHRPSMQEPPMQPLCDATLSVALLFSPEGDEAVPQPPSPTLVAARPDAAPIGTMGSEGSNSVEAAGGAAYLPAPPTAVVAASSHRPRLVRAPSPLRTYLLPSHFSSHSAWAWTKETSLQSVREEEVQGNGDVEMRSSVPPSAAPIPSTTLFSIDSDSMDIDFHAIDVDAIVQLAKQKAKEDEIQKRGETMMDVIDLTSSQPEASTAASTASSSAAAPVDIEDLLNSSSEPVPLRFRPSPPLFFVTDFSAMNWCEKQVDLATRLGKRKATPEAQARMDAGTAIHLAYELETVEKVNVHVQSHEDVWALRLLNMMLGVQELAMLGRTRELPVFGYLQLPDVMTEAIPPSRSSKHRLPPQHVWVMGIIDEVVRLDLFDSEMHKKRATRDEILARSPRRRNSAVAEAAASAATAADSKRSSSPSYGVASSPKLSEGSILKDRSALEFMVRPNVAEKRKRGDATEMERLFGGAAATVAPPISRPVSMPNSTRLPPPPAPVRPAPVFAPQPLSPSLAASIAASTSLFDLVVLRLSVSTFGSVETQIDVADSVSPPLDSPSQSLMDVDISDEDVWQLLSENSEQQWQIEREISQEMKMEKQKMSDEAVVKAHQPHARSASSSASPPLPRTTTPAAASSVPPLSRSVSLPPLPPPAAAPSFPISRHHVVLDHKTRASNSMPSVQQKIGTYLQVSIYKMMLDRWLDGSEEQKGDVDMEERKFSDSPVDRILDDADLPPFPVAEFFAEFKLKCLEPLSPALQSHMAACGLSPDLSLSDLLMFTLASFKTVGRTYREMKVEYEYQKDKRVSV